MAEYITPEGLRHFMAEAEELRGEIDRIRLERNATRAGKYTSGGEKGVSFYSSDVDVHNQEEHVVMQRLAYVEDILKCAVCPVPETCDRIRIGHFVEAEQVAPEADENSRITFYMAGKGEGDVPTSPPRYSYLSPFANPFLGREVGDEVTVVVSGQKRTYEVMKITLPAAGIEWPLRRASAA